MPILSKSLSVSFRNYVLMGVYAMYMLLLPAVMSGAASHTVHHWGKWFNATRKQDNAQPTPTTDYTMLLKHEDNGQRTVCTAPVLLASSSLLPALCPITESCVVTTAPVLTLCLPNDAFKRYRLFQVFLV